MKKTFWICLLFLLTSITSYAQSLLSRAGASVHVSSLGYGASSLLSGPEDALYFQPSPIGSIRSHLVYDGEESGHPYTALQFSYAKPYSYLGKTDNRLLNIAVSYANESMLGVVFLGFKFLDNKDLYQGEKAEEVLDEMKTHEWLLSAAYAHPLFSGVGLGVKLDYFSFVGLGENLTSQRKEKLFGSVGISFETPINRTTISLQNVSLDFSEKSDSVYSEFPTQIKVGMSGNIIFFDSMRLLGVFDISSEIFSQSSSQKKLQTSVGGELIVLESFSVMAGYFQNGFNTDAQKILTLGTRWRMIQEMDVSLAYEIPLNSYYVGENNLRFGFHYMF